jgi:hypothetical protein
MRNADQHQDRDEGGVTDPPPGPGPDHERDQPVSSSAADSKPLHGNGRRLSRAEERHLREWAGNLVSGLVMSQTSSYYFAAPCSQILLLVCAE